MKILLLHFADLFNSDDNSRLPELSFEDFLDTSPTKHEVCDNNVDIAVYSTDEAVQMSKDSLHTPGPKIRPVSVEVMPPSKHIVEDPLKVLDSWDKGSANLAEILQDVDESSTSKSSTTELKKPEAIKIMAKSVSLPIKAISLSGRNIVATNVKSTTIATMPSTSGTKIVRIAAAGTTTAITKSVATSSFNKILASSSGCTTTTNVAKTALKASNGKIFYIQNATKADGTTLPVVRLQPKTSAVIVKTAPKVIPRTATTTTTAAATTTTTTITTANVVPVKIMQSNSFKTPITTSATTSTTTTTVAKPINPNVSGKVPVKVQILRATDGKMLPFKANTAVTATTSTTVNTTTPTTTMSAVEKLFAVQKENIEATKKLINIGNGVRYMVATSKSNTNTTNTTTTTTTITTAVTLNAATAKTTTSQSSVISIKIPLTTAATTTTITTTTTMTTTTPSAISTTTTNTTAAATTTNTTTTTTTGSKLIIQSQTSKPLVLNKQQIFKLNTKPLTTIAATTVTNTSTTTTTTTTTSTTPKPITIVRATEAGKIKAIKIPGKPGINYVRLLSSKDWDAKQAKVLNKSISTTASSNTNTNTTTTITTTTTTTTATATTPSSSCTAIMYKNKVAQNKFTIVRETINGGAGSKIILGKPVKDVDSKNLNIPKASSYVLNKMRTYDFNSNFKRFAEKADQMYEEPAKKRAMLQDAASIQMAARGREILTKVFATKVKLETKDGSSTTTATTTKPTTTTNTTTKTITKITNTTKTITTTTTTTSPTTFNVNTNSSTTTGKVKQLFGSTLSQMNIETISQKQEKEREIRLKQVQQQLQQQSQQHKQQKAKIVRETTDNSIMDSMSSTVVRRKHCNCSKSQCLKLYCDCFANGEFCQDCTCRDCKNNLSNEDERQRAIKLCLERNPTAFQPKITTCSEQQATDVSMRHNKGCNCKRSSCLKNYCECYEAKIPCSANCKCIGCRNVEERPDLNMDPIDPAIMATIKDNSPNNSNLMKRGASLVDIKKEESPSKRSALYEEGITALVGDNEEVQVIEKQSVNFITSEVIGATVQCMISQADQCVRNGLVDFEVQKLILEEMARCLVEIIDFSIRNTSNASFTQD